MIATPLYSNSSCIMLLCSSSAHKRISLLASQMEVGLLQAGLIWTISLFSTCAAKDLSCVFNRFRRTGPVPSSDKLKRLSCESKSARDFRRLGFKSTSPFNLMKWIADESLSATKTTPLVKHRSRAYLNTSFRTFTSTGRCKRSSTRRDSRESKS